MWVAFANAKATHIFSAKILAYVPIFNDQSFNDMLPNDIVSFEQLGPDVLLISLLKHMLWELIRSISLCILAKKYSWFEKMIFWYIAPDKVFVFFRPKSIDIFLKGERNINCKYVLE